MSFIDETLLARLPTIYLWVMKLNDYETIEWNFALRVCVFHPGFNVLETTLWNYPLRLALYCSDLEVTLSLITVALLQIHKISATCIFFELVYQSKLSTPWQCGIGRQRATTIYFVDFASFVFKLRTTCSLASLGSI